MPISSAGAPSPRDNRRAREPNDRPFSLPPARGPLQPLGRSIRNPRLPRDRDKTRNLGAAIAPALALVNPILGAVAGLGSLLAGQDLRPGPTPNQRDGDQRKGLIPAAAPVGEEEDEIFDPDPTKLGNRRRRRLITDSNPNARTRPGLISV